MMRNIKLDKFTTKVQQNMKIGKRIKIKRMGLKIDIRLGQIRKVCEIGIGIRD